MKDVGSEDRQMITGKSCPDACQAAVAGYWHTSCQRAGNIHGVISTAHLPELELCHRLCILVFSFQQIHFSLA